MLVSEVLPATCRKKACYFKWKGFAVLHELKHLDPYTLLLQLDWVGLVFGTWQVQSHMVFVPFQHMPSLTPQPPLNGSCYCGWKDKCSKSFHAVVPFLNGLISFLSGTKHKSVAESWLLHFLCAGQSLDPNRTPCCVQIGHLAIARCIAALSDLHISSLTSCFNVSLKYLSAQHNCCCLFFF